MKGEERQGKRTTSPSVCLEPLCQGEGMVMLTLHSMLKKTCKKGEEDVKPYASICQSLVNCLLSPCDLPVRAG